MKKITLAGLIFAFSLWGINAMAHASLAPAPSPCATGGTPFVTLTQHITNDPDSGTSGTWATDAFTEHVAVWLGSDNATYCANASTTDGTFVTNGDKSPEKGTYLAPGITGTFTGGETYTIPSTTALSDLYSTSTPTSTVLPDSNTAGFSWWVNDVFPSIASSSGLAYTNAYSLTYVTAHDGTWTDANTGDIGDLGPAVNQRTLTGYGTIQAAVDAAQAGDTIDVATGTYTENVTISTPLTLDGAQAGVDARGRSGDEALVDGTFTLATSSVTIDGFTIVDPSGGYVFTIGGNSNETIRNNIIDNKGYVATFSGSNIVFTRNAITNDDPSSGIEANSDPGSTFNISENSFTGVVPTADFTVIGNPSPITSDVTVSGNTDNSGNTLVALFHTNTASVIGNTVTSTSLANDTAIYIGGDVHNVSVSSNTLNDVATGIKVANAYGDGVNSSVAIASNTLNNDTYGLRIGSDSVTDASEIVANNNTFASDTVAGVENDLVSTSTAVTAMNSWWGASTGPTDMVSGDGSTPDTNASGTGSAAIGAVKYSGWCTNLYCDMTPPTLVYNAPASSTIATSSLPVSVTVSDAGSGILNVFVHVYNASGTYLGACGSGAPNLGGVSSYTYICTLNVSSYSDGIYLLKSGTNDMAGNNQTVSLPFTVNHEYVPGPSVPMLAWPVNGDITPTNDFYFTWNPSFEVSSGTIRYEFHSTMNPAETNGVLSTDLWDSGVIATTTLHSQGASDGTWYWQVRAIDAASNTSAWSNVWAVTLNTAPTPALAACPTGTITSLVETDTVNSASSTDTIGTNNLSAGQTYLLVASGTWKNANLNVTDPAYASVDNWTTYMRGYNIAPYYEGTNDLELQVDNAFVGWGAYQPSHEYSYLYTGTGSPVSFRVFDGNANASSPTPTASWYGDNSGNLHVSVYACRAPVYVTTDAATNVSQYDATLNGTNDDYGAAGHSFWVSTSTFSTSSANIPAGVYSTPDFGAIASNTPFSASLSSLTTKAYVHGQGLGTMPAVQPGTTYYYVAWSYSNGSWHPGAMQSFTTLSPYVTTDAATNVSQYDATLNGTNGFSNAQNTSFWWGTTPAGPFTAGGNTTEFPTSSWNHDTGLGSASIGGSFNEPLTGLTPSTTYYYAAWSQVGGVWYPGDVLTFTTPALGSDATLSALGVSNGMLAPSFDSGTTPYIDTLPYNTNVVPTVTATTTDPNAKMVIDQATSTTGMATVVVTAQDGVTTKDYTVQFALAPATSSFIDVVLNVNNSAGGSATSSDFLVNMIASNPSTSSFPGSAAGTLVTVDPNTNIDVNTTSSQTNYVENRGGDCHIQGGLPAGNSAICTITETYESYAPQSLRVTVAGGPGSNGPGAVLGASVSGNAALEAEIQVLQQQLAALLQQYLALLRSQLGH